MGTYNGQAFLAEQLLSIENQSHKNWRLVLSDDGSTDDTLLIARAFQEKWGRERLEIRNGPEQGFCKNFLSLACDPITKADFYAFSDQDDIWEKEKLKKAIECLEKIPKHIPAMYCGRTHIVNENNEHLSFSTLHNKEPSFANALVQSLAGGNTTILNQATQTLLCVIGSSINVISHDWLTYLIVTSCGGRVFYDSISYVHYRQHKKAIMGDSSSWKGACNRIKMLWDNGFKQLNDEHIDVLVSIYHLLTPDNQKILDIFREARKKSFFARINGIKKSGIYRQTLFGNLGLIVATILNKI